MPAARSASAATSVRLSIRRPRLKRRTTRPAGTIRTPPDSLPRRRRPTQWTTTSGIASTASRSDTTAASHVAGLVSMACWPAHTAPRRTRNRARLALVSITQNPVGPMTRWSMLAALPGTALSLSTTQRRGSFASKAAVAASPSAPRHHRSGSGSRRTAPAASAADAATRSKRRSPCARPSAPSPTAAPTRATLSKRRRRAVLWARRHCARADTPA
jgi:hypothetical protein